MESMKTATSLSHEEAADAVDKVFRQCYADTRPFKKKNGMVYLG